MKPISLFVATDGCDGNAGTMANPFASLERARDAIRALKSKNGLPEGGLTVWIRGGRYECQSTLTLGTEDSGTASASIIYRAYKNEEVRLTGGREVTGFGPIDDPAILERIDGNCRDKILQADLKALGIADYGSLASRGYGAPLDGFSGLETPILPAGLELFFRDQWMTLARWPDTGWTTIAGVPAGQHGDKLTYTGDRPERWSKAKDIWLHGYWTARYAPSYTKVKSIDTHTREITTEEPHGAYGYTSGMPYYFLNVLEELSKPGQWYLDRQTGIIYFWPPEPIDSGNAVVSVLETPILSLRDVSYVTFRGLTFEGCRGIALEMIGGSHNLLAGCKLRNIGTYAVVIKGGTRNAVVGCDISDAGDGGIVLAGGDRKTLTPGDNCALNNHIYRFARLRRSWQPGIAIGGVGNRAQNNCIHDAPGCAILYSGNDHTIEFNEIYGVCTESYDMGAVYSHGHNDPTWRGNTIRYNYLHDFGKPDEIKLGNIDLVGVYLDDFLSGTTVFGNIFYKTGYGVLIGGGRDNTVENNIFIDCFPSVHMDDRGLTWGAHARVPNDPAWTDKLSAVNYSQHPYSIRYPELAGLLEDEPAKPKGNRIMRNVHAGGRWLNLVRDWIVTRLVTIEDNWTENAPGFVDQSKRNFQIKDDSPVYKLGFKRIPMEKIGLYKDEYRKSTRVGVAKLARANRADQSESVAEFRQGHNVASPSIVGNLSLPNQWCVFVGLHKEDPVLPTDVLKTMPEEITVAGRRIEMRTISVSGGTFDFAPMFGGTADGNTAYVFIPLEVPRATTVTLGFGADAFMQVWLDGQEILDTTITANLFWPPMVKDHLTSVRLRQGNHVLAIRYISSFASSLLAVGGPEDLRELFSSALSRDDRPVHE